MNKIGEAQEVLKTLGLPRAQQNEISALTLLALCQLGPKDPWSDATRAYLTITKGIMEFASELYRKNYAPNTRETFRRQVLHQFVQAGIADYNPADPGLPTNSPHTHYAISKAALGVVRAYGTPQWPRAAAKFLRQKGSLIELYQKKRKSRLVPVKLTSGEVIELSAGKHNQVQKAIVEEFAPRFAPGGMVLYLGDTTKKRLVLDEEGLARINVRMADHDKLPDVVILDAKRNWLFLVEAVTSHGPMSPKRVVELKKLFSKSPAGQVFVSAFPDFLQFRKHIKEIAWETEVWIMDMPDHMIHYNGDRFLGPR